MSIFESLTENVFGKKTPPPSALAVQSEDVLNALRKVIDPDLHRDIVTLGFVKNLKIDQGKVDFELELTTPACPVKELLKKQSEDAVKTIAGVEIVNVSFSAKTRGSKITAPNIEAALGQVKNIIAVASGKGGVAKSTTAVNLACALAKAGSKVGILDADVYGPSVPKMMGVGLPTETVSGMPVPPSAYGVKAMSIAMFNSGNQAALLRGPMAAQVIKQFLSQIYWGELDYLIIDYPPGTGDIQLTISQIVPVTAAVIVTTPQEMSLIDVRKAVSMFQTLKVPILGVVETMSYFVCDNCDKKHFLFRQGGGDTLSRDIGVPLLGQVPIDATVAEQADCGKPVVLSENRTVASLAYEELSGQVARNLAILSSQDAGALTQFSIVWKKS